MVPVCHGILSSVKKELWRIATGFFHQYIFVVFSSETSARRRWSHLGSSIQTCRQLRSCPVAITARNSGRWSYSNCTFNNHFSGTTSTTVTLRSMMCQLLVRDFSPLWFAVKKSCAKLAATVVCINTLTFSVPSSKKDLSCLRWTRKLPTHMSDRDPKPICWQSVTPGAAVFAEIHPVLDNVTPSLESAIKPCSDRRNWNTDKDVSNHISPDGRARELFSVRTLQKYGKFCTFDLRKRQVLDLTLLGRRDNRGSFRLSWPMLSVPVPNQMDEFLFLFLKRTRRKSASLKPVICVLALWVIKLWTNNHKICNYTFCWFCNKYLHNSCTICCVSPDAVSRNGIAAPNLGNSSNLQNLHLSLGHQGYARLHHFLQQRNHRAKERKIFVGTACVETNPQFLQFASRTFIKGVCPWDHSSVDFKGPVRGLLITHC